MLVTEYSLLPNSLTAYTAFHPPSSAGMAGAVFELGVSCASLIKLDSPHSDLLTAQSDCVYEMGKGGGGGGGG